ncbi:MAG: flavin-containing monooxygenase [Myxococcota bacterium]
MPAPAPRTAVIGAGPSGLATCKVLREHGIPVTCFEAGDRVGGQWVLDNPSGMSSAYRSLRANTHKGMIRFSDFEAPAAYPDFPSHEQMAAWFADYARHFGLDEVIRFGARVTRATRDDDGRWRIEAEQGNGESFDALVAATGNLWDPLEPELPGSFEGDRLHAHDYRDPDLPVSCRGRSVLVIGLGNTGCELAVELARPGGAERVLLSARSGQHIVPRRIGGQLSAPPHPTDRLPWLLQRMPSRLRHRLFQALAPRIVARMTGALPKPEDLGLPPPPRDPMSKRMVVNDDVLELVRQGRIEVRPGVRRLDGTKVEFDDGRRDAVDVVLSATGYRFSLPYLDRELLGCDPDDLALYQGVMHPRHHDLFVVGVMRALCSIWPRSEQQARWIAGRLTGRFRLPPQHTIERRAYPILRVPFTNCAFYTADLEAELGKEADRQGRPTRSEPQASEAQ